MPRRSRVRAGELLIRRWRLPTWWFLILPDLVILKRFLAPDLVFILDILLFLVGSEDLGSVWGCHGMSGRTARKSARLKGICRRNQARGAIPPGFSAFALLVGDAKVPRAAAAIGHDKTLRAQAT